MPSKNLKTLNNGWHLSEHPMACPIRLDIKDGRVFLVHPGCPQALWAATDPDDGVGYTVDLLLLKARIVDHWLKVHADEIESQTWC